MITSAVSQKCDQQRNLCWEVIINPLAHNEVSGYAFDRLQNDGAKRPRLPGAYSDPMHLKLIADRDRIRVPLFGK